jgi:hypothetical protein
MSLGLKIVETLLLVAGVIAELVAAGYVLLDRREASKARERARLSRMLIRQAPRRPARSNQEATDRRP